jgi:hypothetical protein
MNLSHEMIQAANELLAENLSASGGEITFTHEELRKRFQKIVAEATGKDASEVECNTKWLDIEDIFEKAGWIVQYDSPGYNESYDGFFIFNFPDARIH